AIALVAAVLYPLQAVLGAITVVLELPPEWVTIHLANAELLLAALTVFAIVVRWPSATGARAPGWTWLAIAAAAGTFVLLVSGAYVRGVNATVACPGWPLCGEPNAPANAIYTTANRLYPPIDFPSTGPAAIAMLHRYIAAGVGLLVIAACVEAWRHRRETAGLGPLAVATAAIFIAQVAIGAANPLSGFSPWALGAHPAAASLLWCSMVALATVASRAASGQRQLVRDLITLTKPAIAGTLFYILVYTIWLKRTTVQNIVIGGAAGAIPPLVGWAAITGSLDLSAFLLFAIVFFWTPAHFWALALLIRDDYARAGVP